MSNPIKSASTAATSSTNGAQGVATASLPADWLARATGERVSDGASVNSFARWMSQHSQQTQPLTQVAEQNKPPVGSPSPNNASNNMLNAANAAQTANEANQANAANAAKSGPGWSTTQARLAAQRSQVAPSARAASGTAKPASPSQAAAEGAQPAANPQAAGQQEAAQQPQGANGRKASKTTHEAKDAKRGDEPDGAQVAEAANGVSDVKGDKDEVRYSTALGDGGAIVRELTPPPGVQATDPAGMMAWLAQLTQTSGDVAQGVRGTGKGLDAPSEDASAADGGLSGVGGDGRGSKGLGRDLAEPAGRGADQAFDSLNTLNTLNTKADLTSKVTAVDAHADIALQADALLKATPDRADKDAAALMAADGARLAGFGQTLAEVKQASPHVQASLPTPLDAPDFSQKLADQVSVWVGQARNDGPMTAELHLNPAEMGPINVKISLDGQSAHVDFAAAAQETRHAIQASLSMLSSSLNDVGLSLSGGGVFSQTSQQQAFAQGAGGGMGSGNGGNGQSRGRGTGSGGDDDALGLRQVSAPRSNRLGGLDLYA